MTTTTSERGGLRIVVWGMVLALVTVLIYWFSTRDPNGGVPWSVLTAVVLGLIAMATGAAMGSAKQVGQWTTWESVLAAVLAGVIGALFWAWALFWNLLDVIKNGIPGYGMAVRDLFYGLWFLAAILVPYIVRRPGAAVAAEVVAAVISALLGSQWGLTVLISGLVQGGLAELVYALRGYRSYSLATLLLAAGGAALGSWVVDYAFWYNTLQMPILLLMLLARVMSAGLLAALLGRAIGDALVATGVLDNTALGRQQIRA